MWRPPQRIKHPLPAADWPDLEQVQGSRLFSQIPLGSLMLEQRTWVPAMVPWRASETGYVTPELLAWYERFARGCPGAIVVEATGIRDIPSGPLLRIGDDRFVPGLQELTQTVRRASAGRTRLLIQLIDFLGVRRRPEPEKYFQRFLKISERHRRLVPGHDAEIRRLLAEMPRPELEQVLNARELEALDYGLRERVTDMEQPEIAALPEVLPELFASAATRAEQAGLDGVELHYAHAYTMASFLSALNTRPDGYGGSRKNRVKLPLEVYAAVRQATSGEFAVGCRFLTRDAIPGGNTVEDAVWFAERFAAAGMDFLSLSRGGKFEDAKQPRIGQAVYPYTGPSGYECMPTVISDQQGPFGRNIAETARVRQAIRDAGYDTPVVVAGGICGFEQAEGILARGEADIIAAARQTLADPDWFLKVALGRGGDVRRCQYTNYCEGLDQKHKPVTCKLWDRVELDRPGLLKTSDGRRRLVAPPWKGE